MLLFVWPAWMDVYLCEVQFSAGFDSEEVGAGFGLVAGEGAEDLYLVASHESDSD